MRCVTRSLIAIPGSDPGILEHRSQHTTGTPSRQTLPEHVIDYLVLCGMPTTCYQLTTLSTLRPDAPETCLRVFLSALFGEEFVLARLGRLHALVFDNWLSLSIYHQMREIGQFLSGLNTADINSPLSVDNFASWVPYLADSASQGIFNARLRVTLRLRRLESRNVAGNEFRATERVWRTAELLEKASASHGDSRLTLNDLAAHFSISPTRLGDDFHCFAGTAFREYLRLIRVWEVTRLLGACDAELAQIIAHLHSTDVGNLYRDFRAVNRESPGRFHRRYNVLT